MNRVLFFCDGGNGYGLGHVMRCLALAEALTGNGYRAEFIINGTAVVDDFSYKSHCIPQLWPEQATGEFCVIDSYTIREREMNRLWLAAKSCLWLDDENLRAYPGGTVINPSLFGNELVYNNPGVKHLLGQDYIILRQAFRRRRIVKVINETINELTVIMGGTDARNLLPEIVENISILSCKKNIIGASQVTFPGYNVLPRLSAGQLTEVFLRSDIVISAGGQTVNELIQMNTPAILIEAADNQRNNIRAAVKRGLAVTCMPGDILHAADKMDYDTRLRLKIAMKKYDFSNGVFNIIREF